MRLILVDSSVWIDYFNDYQSIERDKLKAFINNDSVCICPAVYQEVLQGVRNDKVYSIIKQSLLEFNLVKVDIMEVTSCAIDIYRTLRKRGITIRKTMDCLIAAYAIFGDIPLLHKDRDFIEIAKHCNLKTII